ncbi:hypothetical protein O7635_26920 [Asanoa sp. WMMD1127]|uniref:hypothetical protein n=1 Tax=Asanoa sp. WMMD1127 TaxID=3016107 RepID=UPI0024176976|nr:hypothetical protein [Asanoa sp. WMMD1127]MDG4825496.1 hypothetical protein [Asanoa sp. WMMD1127]
MAMEGLEPVADVSAGDWLAAALPRPNGAVSGVVPGSFPAYARVLHPVERHDGGPDTTWAQVCQATGRVAHPLMQWLSIITRADGSEWTDGDVRPGALAPPALAALLDVLAPYAGDQVCWHALWEGWGWVGGGGVAVMSVVERDDDIPGPRGIVRYQESTADWDEDAVPALAPPFVPTDPGVPREVWDLPRLRLPDRDYLLYRGPLRAALAMGHDFAGAFEPQSPSLLWPADHAWCVGTEIDFDSTLVAGPPELIAAVLAAPTLEAYPVRATDDLSLTGDRINT